MNGSSSLKVEAQLGQHQCVQIGRCCGASVSLRGQRISRLYGRDAISDDDDADSSGGVPPLPGDWLADDVGHCGGQSPFCIPVE